MFAFAGNRRNIFDNHSLIWLLRLFRTRNLAIIFTTASVISVIATYYIITHSKSPFGPDPKSVLAFITIDLIFLLALAAVISKRVVKLIIERRKGSVGSMLQTRIVLMFSLVAIIPSIVMAVFSLLFFNYGIQAWFDKKVSTAIDESVEIATLYLEEHKKIIGADILGMARDLNRDAYNIRKKPRSFSSKLSLLAGIRKIPEAMVFKKSNNQKAILARTNFSFSLGIILEDLSDDIIKRADAGELIILTNDNDDRVIALTRLENFFNAYLLVGRFVDNTIINHIERTEGAANEYTKLKSRMSDLQIKFFIIFVIVALLLLFAVVWLGFIFAVSLVTPVKGLISATEKVKQGDLTARVLEGHENDEIATLGRAFNRMTEQLERQRNEIVSAQRRAAWSDVARRIAHEIKNPLTPIQLATNRLQKKYASELKNSNDFSKYMDTISRNVDSIRGMVDEFVSFARIPQPVFANNNLSSLIEDVIFAQKNTNASIQIKYSPPETSVIFNCDGNQITRVLTNLLKNSAESIEEKMLQQNDFTQGVIEVSMNQKDNELTISIKDNGKGFSEGLLERITEPYVTTKSKGTGLGLAIVKKIVEDHNGELQFNNTNTGAQVSIIFKI